MTMPDSPWPPVLQDLEVLYKKQYLYGQAYNSKSGNLMEILTPPPVWVDKFGHGYRMKDVCFGTKVLNLFIAQAPYGWTADPANPGNSVFSWGDPSSTYAKQVSASVVTWTKIFPRFAKYQTLVWSDMYTPQLVKAQCPDSSYPSMMTQTDSFLKAWCPTVPGFKYMGQITTQVPASFFQPYIDAFYGTPLYRLPSS